VADALAVYVPDFEVGLIEHYGDEWFVVRRKGEGIDRPVRKITEETFARLVDERGILAALCILRDAQRDLQELLEKDISQLEKCLENNVI